MTDAIDPSVAAPVRRTHRLRYAIVVLLCIGAVAWMVALMQKNVVFFKPVAQAVADRAHDGTRTLRIGGAVVPGSIRYSPAGARFELVDRGVTVVVDHHGSEPTLFKDCAPVVADGHWDHATFVSDQILIKHGSTYKPPSNAKVSCPKDPFGR